MAVLCLLLFVFAPQTVALIAPGFDADQQAMYVDLFRIMCFTPVIFAASIVLGEILVAEGRFFAYGLAPLLYNGGIVVGTVLFASSARDLRGGHRGGRSAHWPTSRSGSSGSSGPGSGRGRASRLRTKGVGEFIRLMIPKMLSHPIEPLTFLYFTALASSLTPGVGELGQLRPELRRACRSA